MPRWLWLLLLCASCASTAGSDRSTEFVDQECAWRGLYQFEGEEALVLASRQSSATEVEEFLARARAAVVTVGEEPVGQSFVIALSEGDPFLFPTAEEYERAFHRWAADMGVQVETPREPEGEDGTLEIDTRLVFSLAPIAVSVDDPDLALPAALRERFTSVILMPTSAYVESVCDQMVEAALDAQEITWVERRLLYSFFDPTEMMLEEITSDLHSATIRVWGTTVELSETQANAARAAFDLPPLEAETASIDWVKHNLLPPEVALEHLQEDEDVALDLELGFGTGPSASSNFLYVIRSMGWSLMVDINAERLDRDLDEVGMPTYVWHPIEGMPTRADAEALEALRSEFPGFTLVIGRYDREPALLLAAHAFWVRGLDVDVAVAEGLRFGMDPEFEGSLRDVLRR